MLRIPFSLHDWMKKQTTSRDRTGVQMLLCKKGIADSYMLLRSW